MSKKISGKKKLKEIDWSADGIFDKNRAILYIEHSLECPIFTIKADELLKYLQTNIPDREFVLVRNGFDKFQPRSGAFEIELSQNARVSKHNLWSGVEKGPPRRDKFPIFENLMEDVQKVLKKFYPDSLKNVEDEENELDL